MIKKLLNCTFTLLLTATTLQAQTIVTVGTGSGSGTSAPIASWYESSATESIYTATEINATGNITTLAYQKASGNSTVPPAVKIYLKNTTAAAVAAANYSIGDGFNGYTLVYDGTLPNNSQTGWMQVTLQTPFALTANSNLSILTVGSTCIESGRPQYTYTSASGTKMSAGYNDGSIGCGGNSPWDPASVMRPVWERPNVRLSITSQLSTDNVTKANNSVIVYNNAGKLTVKSANTAINNITVYDVQGKQVFNTLVNNNDYVLDALASTGQLLFVKVTDANNAVSTTKTVY
ncbi:hypothetical protein Q765_17480 [Flavobacterium rivuli WB 3.3-2 = DSM 21788]|uniref:Secretion system C-terminal sorting domain-containing protein n=1 Tax=Flavobacterium rivuli WB 3.3-2 = DSM 21788 TaxID=1121895 RepID=A0A0A2MA78_9FLAO|nr:hypothetical protein [Flavobacterium rivuli]KGO85160.1 hypothetical protein Q765_17480 [Flavobacterium rivuli WB 3.3-2 = DSM 21788]